MNGSLLQRIERATPPVAGLFYVFATLMTLMASVTLIWPGGPLDAIWQVKPAQYAVLKLHGAAFGAGFAVLGLVCAAAGIGSFLRRCWGWLLAVAVIAINFLADLARAIAEPAAAAFVGPVVTALILWWLMRPAVRAQFRRGAGQG